MCGIDQSETINQWGRCDVGDWSIFQIGQRVATELAQIEGMQYVFIDKEQEKRVVRKLDCHILPIFMALCKFSLQVDMKRRRED